MDIIKEKGRKAGDASLRRGRKTGKDFAAQGQERSPGLLPLPGREGEYAGALGGPEDRGSGALRAGKGSERAGGREEQMKLAPVRGADHRPEGGLGRVIFAPEEIEAPGALAAGAVKGDEAAFGAPALRQAGDGERPPENVPTEGPPVQLPREGGGAEPGHRGVVGLPVQELGAHLHPAGRKAERQKED